MRSLLRMLVGALAGNGADTLSGSYPRVGRVQRMPSPTPLLHRSRAGLPQRRGRDRACARGCRRARDFPSAPGYATPSVQQLDPDR